MIVPEEHFERHLKSITAEQWNELFSTIPLLKQSGSHGTIVFPDSKKPDVVTLPVWDWSDALSRFFKVFHEVGLLVEFDWTKWEEGAQMLQNTDTAFSRLDPITLCKLLTAAIRADRFSDGFLVRVFANGNGVRILEELKSRFADRVR